jgi:hypothetical protein
MGMLAVRLPTSEIFKVIFEDFISALKIVSK